MEGKKISIDIPRSDRKGKSKVLDPALSAFLVQLPCKLQNCLKSQLKRLAKDDNGIKSLNSFLEKDNHSSTGLAIDLEKQLQAWRENPSWVNQPPEIEVSVAKGSLCNLKAKVNVGLPPDAVYNIVTDPDNRRVFKNIKEVISRKVLVDEGQRQVVEVEQAALWRFLWWSGTISVHVLVDQNREDHSMKFKQLNMGFMKKFEGYWRVEPVFVDEKTCFPFKPKTWAEYCSCTGGKGRIGSKVSLDQLIQPAIDPPPPISWYLRGIPAKTTEMLVNDLLAEAARLTGGCDLEISNKEHEFSMAVVQANQVLEDQSQIESGQFGTFVGIYDGHGGPEAARYVCDHLFRHFRAITAESQGVVTAETIQRAFHQTEEGFTDQVSELWSTRPNMATVGTCSLVGVIYQRTLFIANLGDSRVVLGKKVGNTGGMAAIQLSTEHNANIEAIRHELKELHPNDPQIVVLRHGVWRVKGIIQVSRSIGDVYMKHAWYNREPINGKFRLPEPMNMPILSSDPTIISHALHPNDSFLILGSDGLWEHLSNEKAVAIVHSHPRAGSAKRLVKAALQEAARKREMRYSDLRKIDKKVRRHFHDDITVIVLFFNHDLISRVAVQDPPVSIRSALEHS